MNRWHIDSFDSEEGWLAQRQSYITSSDAPVIAGVGYTDLYSLWARKTGKVADEPDEKMKVRFAVGHALEPLMLEAVRDLGFTSLFPALSLVISDSIPWLAGTPDAMHPKAIAEFKTVHWRQRDVWESAPSMYAWVQLQHLLGLLGLEEAYAVATVGMNEIIKHHVVADRHAIEALRDAEEKFFRLIEKDIPPPVGGSETKATLDRMYPKSREVKVFFDMTPVWEKHLDRYEHLLSARREVQAELKGLEDEIALHENLVREKMGDADTVVLGDRAKFTWKTVDRKGYEVAPKTYRTFRFNRIEEGEKV